MAAPVETPDMSPRRVVVVGAGLAGVTAAFAIARRSAEGGGPRCEVTVVDARSAVACGTSFQNAGRFCPSSVVLGPPKQAPSPFRMLAPRWLLNAAASAPPGTDPRSPAQHRMEARLSLSLAVWAAHRYAVTEKERDGVIRAHRALAELSRSAMRRLLDAHLSSDALDRVDVKPGTLYLHRGRSELDRDAANVATLHGLGLRKAEALERRGAVARFPWLAGWKGGTGGSELPGAFVAGDDFTADAREFAGGVANAARAHGMRFLLGRPVIEVVADAANSGRVVGVVLGGGSDGQGSVCLPADDVVIACGVAAPAVSGLGAARLPIAPLRGFSLELHGCSTADGSPLPDVALADYASGDLNFQLVPFSGGKLRVVGYADLVGADTSVPGGAGGPAAMLTAHTRFVLPALRWERAGAVWAGLRPMTPDNLPMVGRHPETANVWLCAGHGATGWTTCAGTAELLAAQMVPASGGSDVGGGGGPKLRGLGDEDARALAAAVDPGRFAKSWIARTAAFVGL